MSYKIHQNLFNYIYKKNILSVTQIQDDIMQLWGGVEGVQKVCEKLNNNHSNKYNSPTVFVH